MDRSSASQSKDLSPVLTRLRPMAQIRNFNEETCAPEETPEQERKWFWPTSGESRKSPQRTSLTWTVLMWTRLRSAVGQLWFTGTFTTRHTASSKEPSMGTVKSLRTKTLAVSWGLLGTDQVSVSHTHESQSQPKLVIPILSWFPSNSFAQTQCLPTRAQNNAPRRIKRSDCQVYNLTQAS